MAAEGLVELVIKTYVSVLISAWEVHAGALASNAVLFHGCSPLSAQQAPQLSHCTDPCLLPLGFSFITTTAAVRGGKSRIVLCLDPKLWWKIAELHGLGLAQLHLDGIVFCHRWHAALGSDCCTAVLDVVPALAPKANSQWLMSHLQ